MEKKKHADYMKDCPVLVDNNKGVNTIKEFVKQVADLMKKSVYKKDAVLLVFIFPILCMLVLDFSIVDFTIKLVWR